ncbi:NTE family protein [Rhizobiales bacterium GAS191]|jgi:NTE family protein|nr:NTE family protein [Rhizobiales bacterium GAS113]SEC32918.1 NTE family protein [Rhizobiales bacterium GAS191]
MTEKPADTAHAPRKVETLRGKKAPRAASGKKHVALALQGGGAHGAFTWGVLDQLLEDGRLAIEAITGTSAGAMNAVAFTDGLIEGGPEGARRQLERFWRAVSEDAAMSPVQRSVVDRLLGSWSLDHSPGYLWFDMFTRYASPYEFNPLNINPLKDILESEIDFERLRRDHHFQLFIAATNVHDGKVKVFSRKELTAEKVLASACLPFLFQAVEIDGVPYWDGGYMGNPVLWPLFYNCRTDDILLVQINPVERRETPRTAMDIQNRLNEITFNGALLNGLRMVEFVTRLIEEGQLSAEQYKHIKMHRIDGGEALLALSASTKLNAEWEFLTYLRDLGREAARKWLVAHYDDIGERSTLDLKGMLR